MRWKTLDQVTLHHSATGEHGFARLCAAGARSGAQKHEMDRVGGVPVVLPAVDVVPHHHVGGLLRWGRADSFGTKGPAGDVVLQAPVRADLRLGPVLQRRRLVQIVGAEHLGCLDFRFEPLEIEFLKPTRRNEGCDAVEIRARERIAGGKGRLGIAVGFHPSHGFVKGDAARVGRRVLGVPGRRRAEHYQQRDPNVPGRDPFHANLLRRSRETVAVRRAEDTTLPKSPSPKRCLCAVAPRGYANYAARRERERPTGSMSNFIFQRPEDLHPEQEKEPVAGTCDSCGAEALRRYPVLSEGGWFMVVKCQRCLHSQSRERWHRLGHIRLHTDAIPQGSQEEAEQ